MDLESLDNPADDGEGGPAPLVVGEKSQRVSLWVNEEWRPENNKPLLVDRERGIAYWFDTEDVQDLVGFVKEAGR